MLLVEDVIGDREEAVVGRRAEEGTGADEELLELELVRLDVERDGDPLDHKDDLAGLAVPDLIHAGPLGVAVRAGLVLRAPSIVGFALAGRVEVEGDVLQVVLELLGGLGKALLERGLGEGDQAGDPAHIGPSAGRGNDQILPEHVVDRGELVRQQFDLLHDGLAVRTGQVLGFLLERRLVADPGLTQAGEQAVLDHQPHCGVEVVFAVDLVLEGSLEDLAGEAAGRVLVMVPTGDLDLRAPGVGGWAEDLDVGPEDVELGLLVGVLALRLGAVNAGDFLPPLAELVAGLPARVDARQPSGGAVLGSRGLVFGCRLAHTRASPRERSFSDQRVSSVNPLGEVSAGRESMIHGRDMMP